VDLRNPGLVTPAVFQDDPVPGSLSPPRPVAQIDPPLRQRKKPRVMPGRVGARGGGCYIGHRLWSSCAMKLTKRTLALVLTLVGIVLPGARAAAANCLAGAPCRASGSSAACRGSACCCLPSAPLQGGQARAARPSACPGMARTDAGAVLLQPPVAGGSTLAVLTAIGHGAPASRPQPIGPVGPPLFLSDPTPHAFSPRAPPSC
jgi:hypothetical protein